MAKFNHLNLPDHWQSYWTRYPEGYTILEALINWVSQTNNVIDNVNELNKYMDEFVQKFDKDLQNNVIETLSKWQEDGTLDIIIDIALQTQIDDVEEKIDNTIPRVADLEENKVDKEELVYYDVRHFGAVADFNPNTFTGTDNSEAIQSAIDQAYLSGGKGIVQIPEGNFGVSNIQLRPNVILRGAGSGKTKLYAVAPDVPVIHNNENMILVDCGIEGLWIDGSEFTAEWGLKLSLFTNKSFVKDVHIKNCANGLYVARTWYANFTDMHIEWNRSIGVYLNGEEGPVNGVNFTNMYLNYNAVNIEADGHTYAISWNGCTIEHANWEGAKITSYPSGWVFNGCYWEKNGLSSPRPINIYVDSKYDGEGSVTIIDGIMDISSDGVGVDYRTGRSLSIIGLHFTWNGQGNKPQRLVKSGASTTTFLNYSQTFGTLASQELEITKSDGVYLWSRGNGYSTNVLQLDNVVRQIPKVVNSTYRFGDDGDVSLLLCQPSSYINVVNKSPSQAKNMRYHVVNTTGSSYVAVTNVGGRQYYYLRNKGDYVEYISDGTAFHVISSKVDGS